jgi:hypothetical protein
VNFLTIWLYVVTPENADRPCKVGHSFNPKWRARALNTGSPVPLQLRHVAEISCPPPNWGSSSPHWARNNFARKVEKLAHSKLSGRRSRSEWFDVPVEVAAEAIDGAVKECRFAA